MFYIDKKLVRLLILGIVLTLANLLYINNSSNSDSADFQVKSYKGKIVKSNTWAAKLVYKNKKPFCSGFLVSADKIITAQHCLLNYDKKINNSSEGAEYKLLKTDEFYVLLPHKNNLKKYTVNRIDVKENANSQASTSSDLSILTLQEKANNRPLPIASTHLNNIGEKITANIIGYGHTSRLGKMSEKPRLAKYVVFSTTSEVGGYYEKILKLNSFNGAKACPGDSGSPVVARSDKGVVAIGLVSSVENVRKCTKKSIVGELFSPNLNTMSNKIWLKQHLKESSFSESNSFKSMSKYCNINSGKFINKRWFNVKRSLEKKSNCKIKWIKKRSINNKKTLKALTGNRTIPNPCYGIKSTDSGYIGYLIDISDVDYYLPIKHKVSGLVAYCEY